MPEPGANCPRFGGWVLAFCTVTTSFLFLDTASAEPPPRPLATFEKAKAVARDAIYADRPRDYYCGCTYEPTGRSGGKIDAISCGYEARRNEARGKRLEWEHVVPASVLGKRRACWVKGHTKCVDTDGRAYKGRECCTKVDARFRRMEADLHNLVPAVGELNGDRSDLLFGMVAGEVRVYGRCDFEIGGSPKRAEPPPGVRGDVARIWQYMAITYGLRLSNDMNELLADWMADDPPDEWERLRNERIQAAQGNGNPFLSARD